MQSDEESIQVELEEISQDSLERTPLTRGESARDTRCTNSSIIMAFIALLQCAVVIMLCVIFYEGYAYKGRVEEIFSTAAALGALRDNALEAIDELSELSELGVRFIQMAQPTLRAIQNCTCH